MTVDELLAKVKAAADAGQGSARIVFDTDAACFNVHLVDIDFAGIEEEVTADGAPIFLLTTHYYYGSCACKRQAAQPVSPTSPNNPSK